MRPAVLLILAAHVLQTHTMFRSDPMSFCEIFLQPEVAVEVMSRLGNLDCVQFVDMNPDTVPFSKNYIAEVCRCAEIERRLRNVENEIKHDNIDIPTPEDVPKALPFHDMGACEAMIEKWETDIVEISSNQIDLQQDLLEMKEMRYVLSNIGTMLGTAEIGLNGALAKHLYKYGRLHLMCGVVNRTRSFPFQLMLWRISRGNIYYRQARYDEVLEDPYTGTEVRKVAFLTFCQGELLSERMKKIFTGFKVNIYPCPETDEERSNMLEKIDERIIELEEVLFKAKFYRCKFLRIISRKYMSIFIQVRKAKAIYHMLNFFSLDITKNCLIGQCWIPQKDLKIVQNLLINVSGEYGSNVVSFLAISHSDEEPPTIHRTNKFTYGFQMLIKAYGDSKYGEVNPGFFTVITFPFLFAVMFGDAGHALLLIIFASWMIINEKKYKQPGSEIWNIFFGGRYVILMLGFFSLYTGFLYNEVFSRVISIGSSMWGNTFDRAYLLKNHLITIDYKNRLNRPYFYGMDPIWSVAENKIMIENSIKMKMSLIIGIIHMLFGLIVSIFNHIHFKQYYLIVFQFIPEFTFLFCIFFWLIVLIFYKWIFFYNGHSETRYGCSCAPQILILFIDMVLYGTTDKKKGEKCEIYLFDNQDTIQMILMTVSLIMIPIILLGAPLYILCRNNAMIRKLKGKKSTFRQYQAPTPEEEAELAAKLARYKTNFGELMIHQAVHTIEFVLSTISHTASYLRLWALSLAHSQLSQMLWMMVLSKLSLQDHSFFAPLKIFFIFPVWALFTISILVVMEGLSAFLHTLRLHWVEFMSKCFIGGGYPFRPFSFKAVLSTEVQTEGACVFKPKKRQKYIVKAEV